MAPNIAVFPSVEHVTPFTGKTLFLAGEDSGYVKAADIKTLFPDATLSVIANAGHWLHVQQPGIFIEQVEQFLQLAQDV
jgi:pimeloyl-ACP methyl ester carboxylesterase